MNKSLIRGTCILGSQQFVTFLAAMTIHVAIGRNFGPETYGLFSLVSAILSIILLSFLMGIPHAVSKFTAETQGCAANILSKGFWSQMTLASGLGMVLFFLAPVIAFLLGDPRLAPLLRLASFAIPLTAGAFVFTNSLNGMRAFGRQAVGLGSLTVFKMFAILAFLIFGFGIDGVVLALPISAAAAFVLSGALCRKVTGNRRINVKKLFRFGAQICFAETLLTVWYYVGLVLLKYLGSDLADVGLFTAVEAITSAPESLFLPLFVALYPNVAYSLSIGAKQEVASHIRNSVYYAFLIMCPLVIGSGFIGKELMGVFYGEAYVRVSFAVAPLVAAVLFRSLFELLDTYIRASGKGALSIRIAAAVLITHTGLCFLLIPPFGLRGLVAAVVISAMIAFLMAGAYVRKVFKLRVNWISVSKIVVCSIIVFMPLYFSSLNGIWAILSTVPCLLVYPVLLILLGELERDDLNRIKGLAQQARFFKRSPSENGK